MAKLAVLAAALSLAATARALVLPEAAVAVHQAPLGGSRDADDLHNVMFGSHHLDNDDDGRSAAESFFDAVSSIRGHIHEDFSQAVADLVGLGYAGDRFGSHHDESSHTIYELISKSKYTTKFAKLVDDHPSVVELLNGTDSNYTLFVPLDKAFDDIPDGHKQPGKEVVEDALRYHIGLGEYPAKRILHTYTLPTAHDEELLGGEPQRLRTSVGLGGVKINFYSKVVAADIVSDAPLIKQAINSHPVPVVALVAKNGVIHAVNHILVPPPYLGRIISLFPDRFSTLLLAYEKTDFVKFIHGVDLKGSTVFVPTNGAFNWLGPRANAFLFNTSKGRKYLKAILKYNIVANATLYTDAFYDKRDEGDDKSDVEPLSHEHFDLPTLLGDAHISVDIARVFGFASIKVNGFSRVVVPNGVGKNGVIHVVNRVPLPPHKGHRHHHSEEHGEIEVSDLMKRLEPYV